MGVQKKKDLTERAKERMRERQDVVGNSNEVPKLPVIARSKTPYEQLTAILKGWNVAKPSPYYNLRIYDVLATTMENPALAEPLLPMLASHPKTRGVGNIRGNDNPSHVVK